MSNQTTPRTGDARPVRTLNQGQAFMLAQAAHAVERIAANLEALGNPASPRCWELACELIAEQAAELAHLGDAIRHASGEDEATEANLAELKARL